MGIIKDEDGKTVPWLNCCCLESISIDFIVPTP